MNSGAIFTSVLLSPDINALSPRPMIETGVHSEPSAMSLYKDNLSFRFLYLQDETMTATKQTIRLFARAVGAKRSAFLIDACFADVFQSCSRICNPRQNTLLLTDGSYHQLNWCGHSLFASKVRYLLSLCIIPSCTDFAHNHLTFIKDSCGHRRVQQRQQTIKKYASRHLLFGIICITSDCQQSIMDTADVTRWTSARRHSTIDHSNE